MRKFKFATMNICEKSVTMSDAENVFEHFKALEADAHGEYTPCTVIHVNGISSYDEMCKYCAERELVVL